MVAVFALTVWFGSSQHCNLEASGIFADHEDQDVGCCPTSNGDCDSDGCNVVEAAAYRSAEASHALVAPDLVVLALTVLVDPAHDPLLLAVRATGERVEPWVPMWHFDRRTVAVPGAPDVLA